MAVQSDGYSCGDWAHWFRCRLLQYVAMGDDDDCIHGGVGSQTFPELLRGDLTNLCSLRGVALGEAERANNSFAMQRRDAMRTLLRAAARKGALPWGTTRLVDFSQDADKASASVAFIDLDEDLEGDDAIDCVASVDWEEVAAKLSLS